MLLHHFSELSLHWSIWKAILRGEPQLLVRHVFHTLPVHACAWWLDHSYGPLLLWNPNFQLFPTFYSKHLVSCLLMEMLKHKSSHSIIILWCFRHCQYLKEYLEVCLSSRMLLVSCIISFLDVMYNTVSYSFFLSASFAGTRSWNAPAVSLQPRQPGSLDTKV